MKLYLEKHRSWNTWNRKTGKESKQSASKKKKKDTISLRVDVEEQGTVTEKGMSLLLRKYKCAVAVRRSNLGPTKTKI